MAKRSRAQRPAPELTLEWVNPPRQERSRDTHARIVEAAQRLLAAGRSWDELTVADLVDEAETSIGAFYNRFRDKDALLHVLQIELHEQGEATAAQAQAIASSAAVPIDALVRAFVSLAVSSYRQQAGLRRALLVKMCHDERFRERATELTRMTCKRLAEILAVRARGVDRERLRTTIEIAHRMVYGTLDQSLLFLERPAGRLLADAVLVDELSIAVGRYLEHQLR